MDWRKIALPQPSLTRRRFIGTTTGVASALATAGLWPTRVLAGGDDEDVVATVAPKPIPGGVTIFGVFIHHFPIAVPPRLQEPSQITDFKGVVTNCRVRGRGTGTDTRTGATKTLNFQVDNGFMQGLFVGVDGKRHHGTFGFV